MGEFHQMLEDESRKMYDEEMEELCADLAKVFEKKEELFNADITYDTYREEIDAFKTKWFKTPREERLHKLIDEQIGRLQRHLHVVVGPVDWESKLHSKK